MSVNDPQPMKGTDISSVDSDSDHTDLVNAVTTLAERVDELTDRMADLEDENEQLREQMARSDAEIKARVHDLEETVEQDTAVTVADSGCETDGQPSVSPEPQTPLEDLVTVPDSVLANESRNTQRAVFVANDLQEYTSSVPAGRAITSGQLRRVLKAGTDASGHQQTVARVIALLDDLGGEHTEVVERRGTRRLIFTDTIVARLSRLAADSHGCDEQPAVGV
jgi:hypothetical protein